MGRPLDAWEVLKIYKTSSGFYIVGYTDNAEQSTMMDCHGAIVKTTAKEVFHPSNDSRIIQILTIIRTDEDMERMTLTKGQQHTLFIHKSLMRHPKAKDIQDKATKGKGNKGKRRKELAKGRRQPQ